MIKFFRTWVICCVLGATLVKGFDKMAFISDVVAKVVECKMEVGAQNSDITELIEKKPASTMEGKCLQSCIMKKYEVMDDNGKYNKEVAMMRVQKFAEEIIDSCSSIEVPEDHCEAAVEYRKCFKEQTITHSDIEDFLKESSIESID